MKFRYKLKTWLLMQQWLSVLLLALLVMISHENTPEKLPVLLMSWNTNDYLTTLNSTRQGPKNSLTLWSIWLVMNDRLLYGIHRIKCPSYPPCSSTVLLCLYILFPQSWMDYLTVVDDRQQPLDLEEFITTLQVPKATEDHGSQGNHTQNCISSGHQKWSCV